MKKEFMASILTVTAGMASTVSFPHYALAQSTYKAEKYFEQKFRLQLDVPARYKNHDGTYIAGRIYLEIEQKRLTPSEQNQIHGEMTGYLYFESDDYTNTWGDRKYKTSVPLMGDDGFGLLDLIHKDKENGRTYQLYGCNSTLTYCDATTTEVFFRTDDLVKMNLDIPQDLGIEVEVQKNWITGGRNLDLKEIEITD